MGDSPLFTVPLEIRQLIYEYYLSFEHCDLISYKPQWEAYLDNEPISHALPSLMITCKRVYTEMRWYVHSTAVVRFIGPGGYLPSLPVAAHGILRFERLHHLVLKVCESDLRGPGWSEFFEAIARKMCVLKHLTIDWAFTLRLEEYNEDHQCRFIKALHSITSLRTIRIYGFMRDSWRRVIAQEMNGTNVVIRTFPRPWWHLTSSRNISSNGTS
ncbi:hypothetical protein F4680DRAFT_468000 [Xylaria scruposa]|nr:hypothetical protein F4680DRAFT_468000 [Xylaria scruposa]